MRLLIGLVMVVAATALATARAAAQSAAPATGVHVLQTVDGTTIGQVTIAPLPYGWHALGKDVYQSNMSVLGAATPNGRPASSLNVKLGGLATAVAPPSSAAVVANEIELQIGNPTTPTTVTLYCAEVDILGSPANGTYTARAFLPGIVLDGRLAAKPTQALWGNCAARTSSSEPPPANFSRIDPTADARVKFAGAIWWRDGSQCQRWDFARPRTGLQLLRTFRTTDPASNSIIETSIGYNFESGDRMLYAPWTKQRWIRAPRGLAQGLGGVGASSGVFGFRIVNADRDRFVLLFGGAADATSYRESDAVVWYRSLRSCKASP